ncbi:uncharacterized protein CTRU02_201003 [Colletotrichum truncatum]|uniref:Uncharacterized protein n=1 Tax=Colletotrichum truncatum TaxID=5467 RepID=A0ACC3ZGR1_COLTU|nr:uncharacterized protein CTRU02_00774 [Colletotrichum truncatum]KAF6802025.1 hypothetical protein CTRU02_00774 [Colletotrichum truncatum]
MMNSQNVQPGTVTKDELEKTGWEEDDEISDEEAHEWRKSLETADGKMNVDNEFPRAWYHSNPWKDDQGRTRRATTGSMGNIVNAKDGYIIAGVNFAPWDVKPKDMEAWELPSTKWTDIVAVQWSMYASGSSLQRIYRSSIVFERTKDLIEGALNKVGKGPLDKLPKWPGVDYTPKGNLNKTPYQAETEGFFGLLGSPHGAGAAYLLIQYRAIFGKKRITKIKVWSGPLAPNMILYVEDV